MDKTAEQQKAINYLKEHGWTVDNNDEAINLESISLLLEEYATPLKKRIEELEAELTIIHDQFNGSGFFW